MGQNSYLLYYFLSLLSKQDAVHHLEVEECGAACRNMCIKCDRLWLFRTHSFPWPAWFSRDTARHIPPPAAVYKDTIVINEDIMAMFKQQKVEDFYDIGEELGR